MQGNSYCDLASATATAWWGNTNKSVDIINNDTGIYVGGGFCGNLVINHTSQNTDKINFEHNSKGIFSEGHSGSINIVRARMVENNWAIYSYGNMSINNINGAYNTRGIVNFGATIDFNSGSFYSDSRNLKEFGIYNQSGTINLQGGNLYNDNVGIWNAGTVNITNGQIGNCTTGIENYGNLKLTNGTLNNGTIGIDNSGTCNMFGGQITDYSWGVRNIGTFNMAGGNITQNSDYGIVNQNSNTIVGQMYFTAGNITGNSKYDIYHEKSDDEGAGATYGGLRIERNDTVPSTIYLATYNNYIYVGANTPKLNSITLSNAHLERKVIRTSNTTNATKMVNNAIVNNKGGYYCKDNATGYSSYVVLWQNYTITVQYKTKDGKILDTVTKTCEYKENYTTEEKSFEGYTLSEVPTNSSGSTTGNITVVYYYEGDGNVAVVNYRDLLSGIISAKYWYNANSENFSGNGMNFSDGQIFEDYGYYKIVITNGVGLQKELTFLLNQDSV